jgi:hypothetical protein
MKILHFYNNLDLVIIIKVNQIISNKFLYELNSKISVTNLADASDLQIKNAI